MMPHESNRKVSHTAGFSIVMVKAGGFLNAKTEEDWIFCFQGKSAWFLLLLDVYEAVFMTLV